MKRAATHSIRLLVGLLLVVTLTGGLAAARGVGARQPYVPGRNSAVPFRWGEVTSEGRNHWRIAFERAAAAWERAQDRLHFSYSPNPTPDNVMQVYHVAVYGQYGRTMIRSREGLILSAHMELNRYMCDGTGPDRDALRKSVAAHEQGHGLGLDDMNDIPSIMNQTRDRTRLTEPTEHDVKALHALYPHAAGRGPVRPSPRESAPRMISAHADYRAPDGTLYRWITDVQAYRSTAEMVRAADVVVVGTVVAKEGTRVNLERDPLNPEAEHPTRRSLATPYTVEVEEYLKGEDRPRIKLLQPSHLSLPDSPVLVEDRTQRPYEVGERYILFLKRGVLGNYYGTIGEPGAFIIRDGKAEVNSGFREPHAWYRPTPADRFIAALRKQGRAAGR